MNDIQQIFVDGIANLSFSAGAFRFDLATIKQLPAKEKSNKVEVEPKAHVIMTPQAFIQTFRAMERFVKLVEEKGVIRFSEQPEESVKADS